MESPKQRHDRRIQLEKEILDLEKELRSNEEIVADMLARQRVVGKRLADCRHLVSLIREDQRRLHVSEHAVLRYAERYYGVDVEAIRREIETALAKVANLGIDKLTFAGFVVKGATVVTYFPTGETRYGEGPSIASCSTDEGS